MGEKKDKSTRETTRGQIANSKIWILTFFIRTNHIRGKLQKKCFFLVDWLFLLEQPETDSGRKNPPQNFWTKRTIFFAKYCNKLVKNKRVKKRYFLVANPKPPPPLRAGPLKKNLFCGFPNLAGLFLVGFPLAGSPPVGWSRSRAVTPPPLFIIFRFTNKDYMLCLLIN